MINIFTDKEVTVSFNIDIEGNKHLPEGRFVMNLDSGMQLGIKALIEGNTAKVTLPPLRNILKESNGKVVSSFFEVIADGAYYVPWKGSCDLKESISVNVDSKPKIEEKDETVSVNVKEEKTEALFSETKAFEKLNENSTKTPSSMQEKGYAHVIKRIKDKVKNSTETLTKEQAEDICRGFLKEAISMQKSATSQDEKEFSNGFYNGVFLIMSQL